MSEQENLSERLTCFQEADLRVRTLSELHLTSPNDQKIKQEYTDAKADLQMLKNQLNEDLLEAEGKAKMTRNASCGKQKPNIER